jgi:hypothetical protein
MSYARNATHVADGVLKFAAPFWGKPRWAALFAAIGRQVQDVEDAINNMITARFLANATGAQLRVLGGLVGQVDPGLGEEVFRSLIRVRIRINRSKGGRNDVIAVLQLLGIPLAQRTIANVYPAKIRVDFTGALPLPIGILTSLLNDTCSAGVGCVVVHAPSGTPFAFSNATATPGKMFANQATGGTKWPSVSQV